MGRSFADEEPVLVLGMHRSGTTLLTQILMDMGVFMGARRDPNEEAVFFLELNEALLHQSGASWDAPENFDLFLESKDQRGVATELSSLLLKSRRFSRFLGRGRYLFGGARPPKRPWGWKDPRNSFTWPFWKDVMPGLRLINVKRHGVDAAQSIVRRQAVEIEGMRKPMRWFRGSRLLRWAYSPRFPLHKVPLRSHTLASAFRLWDDYCTRSVKAVRSLKERGLELRYEDLLSSPDDVLPRVASFVGVPWTPELAARCKARIRADRAYAFESDPALRKFATANAAILKRHGYGAAPR